METFYFKTCYTSGLSVWVATILLFWGSSLILFTCRQSDQTDSCTYKVTGAKKQINAEPVKYIYRFGRTYNLRWREILQFSNFSSVIYPRRHKQLNLSSAYKSFFIYTHKHVRTFLSRDCPNDIPMCSRIITSENDTRETRQLKPVKLRCCNDFQAACRQQGHKEAEQNRMWPTSPGWIIVLCFFTKGDRASSLNWPQISQ